jgi:hypothetical protein
MPQPGDLLHVAVDGADRAVIPFDGRPTIDGGCSPQGDTVTGAVTPGATLVLQQASTVTIDGDRYTATFPRPLRGSGIMVTGHSTAPALDGSPVAVQVRRTTSVSCALGTEPLKNVKLGISRDKLRRVPVDRRGRFELTTRLRCPPELPTCRVTSGAVTLKRNGDLGRSLGIITYSVPGGTNRRMRGQLKPRALAALRRSGQQSVQFVIVIRPPATLPRGIGARGLHGGYPGVLLAPRR